MNDTKCPFCQQELKDQWVGQNIAHQYFDCPKCKMNGNPKLWQELIRTRKALDVAVDALDAGRTLARIAGFEMLATGMDEAVNKITVLEQKDVK